MAQKPTLGKGLASLLPGAAQNNAAHTKKESEVVSSKPGPSQNDGRLHEPVPAGQASGAVQAGAPTFASVSSLTVDQPAKDRWPGITLALIEEILVNPYQPRREFREDSITELAQSIEANGIIQPLVVRKTQGGYQLIAGERRLRAAKSLGMKQVPVVIRKSTDKEALEVALIENIQRENLNCVDEALAYFQLIQDFTLTQEEVAQRVGKDRATISNYLRLLRLPEAIIDDLKRSILSFGHGKALLALEDSDNRLRARAIIVEKRLSVRDTEALVDHMRKAETEMNGRDVPAATEPEPAIAASQARINALSQDLSRKFGSRVDIRGSDKRGKIVVHYTNKHDLERVLELLLKSAPGGR